MDYVRPLTNMLDICLTLEPNFSYLEDLSFLDSEDAVYLLGKTFPAKNIDAVREFSRSIIWFTYRRNWPSPIGGFGGPRSDRGWGCMIRCGQMLLAQCLSLVHLGSEWRWNGIKSLEDNEEQLVANYKQLLLMFQDKRTAQYSIHQIAQMGVSEGKQLGDWLGPNTMGQVLKKLVIYDNWSRLVVHVAMDNVLISSDIRIVAMQKSPVLAENQQESPNEREEGNDDWERPLLLIIPLRLGLTAINPCYLDAVIDFFKLPQCVGILGGRPNHAVYFYGAVGNKFLYLDPHVCQEFQDLDGTQAPLTVIGDHPGNHFEEEHPTHQHHTTSSTLDASSPPSEFLELQSISTSTPREDPNGTRDKSENTIAAANLILSSYGSASPYCSNNSSSSHCSLEQTNDGTATTFSFATSSSISKLSSPNGDCRSRSSITSEPEMPIDPVMDKFIESFADRAPSILCQRKNDDISADGNENREEKVSQNTLVDELQQRKEEEEEQLMPNGGQAKQGEDEEQQPSAAADEPQSQPPAFDDSTFHCPYLLSMDYTSLDPSLALGFFVRDSTDYKDLVQRLKDTVLPRSSPPLFEILDSRPKGWPEFSLETSYLQDESLNIKEYDDLQYDSDEQFEVLA